MLIDYPPIRREVTPQWEATTKARKLADIAAAGIGCTSEQIFGYRRNKPLVDARKWISREMRAAGYSYPQIAHALNRDHTTILYYLRKGE